VDHAGRLADPPLAAVVGAGAIEKCQKITEIHNYFIAVRMKICVI
jgi:hypothetical protein